MAQWQERSISNRLKQREINIHYILLVAFSNVRNFGNCRVCFEETLKNPGQSEQFFTKEETKIEKVSRAEFRLDTVSLWWCYPLKQTLSYSLVFFVRPIHRFYLQSSYKHVRTDSEKWSERRKSKNLKCTTIYKTIGLVNNPRRYFYPQSATASIRAEWMEGQNETKKPNNMNETMYELECVFNKPKIGETLNWIWQCIGNKGITLKLQKKRQPTELQHIFFCFADTRFWWSTKGMRILCCLLFQP